MSGASGAYRDVLDVPDLPALLTATLFSRLGGGMFTLTIVLYALTRFDSPALAGWMTLAAVGPGVAISPAAGALLDRIGPVRAIAVDLTASAALVAGMIIADLSATGAAPLFVLVALFSLTSPLSTAGVRTLLPRLVPDPALDRANGLDIAIGAIAEVCGPALAGLLVGVAGMRSTLATIAVIYAVAAICVLAIRSRPHLPPGSGSLLGQAVQGLRAVIGQPTLRGLAISYGLYQAAWGMLLIAVPVALAAHLSSATRDLGAGLLWALAGLGGGIGALLAGHLRTAGRERAVMAAGMTATALVACPLAAGFGLTGLLLGVPLAGLVAGAVDVSLLTLRQRRTDPAELGRVMAVSISLNVAGFPVGSALAGVLVSHSVTAAFVAACITAALGAVAVRAIPAEG